MPRFIEGLPHDLEAGLTSGRPHAGRVRVAGGKADRDIALRLRAGVGHLHRCARRGPPPESRQGRRRAGDELGGSRGLGACRCHATRRQQRTGEIRGGGEAERARGRGHGAATPRSLVADGRPHAPVARSARQPKGRSGRRRRDRPAPQGKGLLRLVLTVALPLWVILAPIANASEPSHRIWDPDLKRYLTEEEIGKVEVYLTEEQALKLLFPKSQNIKVEELRLTLEQKGRIQERIGWKFPEESFRAFKAETNGKIDGYAVLQETIGKHRPITYLVGVTSDGKVSDVEILVYRESKGSEVRRKRFNSQYEGKTVLDPIRINKDIINITGATMSVRSVSAGVKRALVLIDEFYRKPR
ncbi:MAG: FMN-binding protein [Nitrospirae bacterium]|nr:MAG: FMN-binding protein [Nitrospirota bacterium]